ncbi:hypothetical protein KJ766_00755, partial [Patescibacteria group bacterium]|nr:hypothetical protein [Patescibacteria group bacterium]
VQLTPSEDVNIADQMEEAGSVQSLADAIVLLPEPEYAVSGREMSNGIYWVWVRKPIENELTHPDSWQTHDESWVVDVQTKKVVMISEYSFGVPFGSTASHVGASDSYFYTHWQAGWESFNTDVKEYIDKNTGLLKVRITSYNNGIIKIENNEKSLEVTLAPEDFCSDVLAVSGVETRQATGIMVNGEFFAFDNSIDIQCGRNDMTGESYTQDLNSIDFWEWDNVVRLGLPGGGEIKWSVDNLEIEAMN